MSIGVFVFGGVMTIRITVPRHERALLWKNRRFVGVIEPGVRWLLAPFNRIEMQLYDLTVPEFEHERVGFLLRQARATMEKYFHIVELTQYEAGLVYKNGELAGVLAPGALQLYWRGSVEVRVEKIDISRDLQLPPAAQWPVREIKETLSRVAKAALLRLEELETLEKGAAT
jgi:hypothetical protein